MQNFTIGVYWPNRSLTLSEFSEKSKLFFTKLKNASNLFSKMQWIGNKSNAAVLISENVGNLDYLISRFAFDEENVFTEKNPDGTPTKDAHCALGFSMRFNTGMPAKSGGVEISICGGISVAKLMNSVIIKLAIPDDTNESKIEVTSISLISKLLCIMIDHWQPDFGKVMLLPFEDKLVPDGFTRVGWLTYIKNTNASAMRNNPDLIAAGIEMEPVSIGGTLFSIDREMVSPENEVQVARAKLLRAKLMENHLIDS